MYQSLTLIVTYLLMSAVVFAAEPDRSTFSKEVITEENERLRKGVEGYKAALMMRRMTSEHQEMYVNQLERMTAEIERNAIILDQENEELLVAAAEVIVRSTIERRHERLDEIRKILQEKYLEAAPNLPDQDAETRNEIEGRQRQARQLKEEVDELCKKLRVFETTE